MEGLSQTGAKISQAMRTIRHEGPEEPEQKNPNHYGLWFIFTIIHIIHVFKSLKIKGLLLGS